MPDGDQPTAATRNESGSTWSPIVELRQYTLRPGTRDTLIELFDREFVETQEAVGMTVIGQFRDLGDPDRFVWLRGFPDMASRGRALTAFYVEGAAWKAHREAARATMVDTTNALLLRPARLASGFRNDAADRPPAGATVIPDSLLVATIHHVDAPEGAAFVDLFARSVVPLLADAGAPILASFATDSSVNTFPALPVREGDNVFVWFSRFADRPAYDRFRARLAGAPQYQALVSGASTRTEVLTLSPTSRSRLR